MFSWIANGWVNLKKKHDGKPDFLDWPLAISIIIPCALFLFAAISPLVNHLPDFIYGHMKDLLGSIVDWYFNLSPAIKGCFALASIGILLFMLIRRFQAWHEKLSMDNAKSPSGTVNLWCDVKRRFVAVLKIDLDKVKWWQHIYFINEDKPFQDNRVFWVWLCIPLISAIYLGVKGFPEGVPIRINFSPDGYWNFLDYFKLPLGILSLTLVTGVMIARMHGSKQRDKAIRVSERKNNFDMRFKHEDQFILYLSKLSKVTTIHPKTEHNIIYSRFDPTPLIYSALFSKNNSYSMEFVEKVSQSTLVGIWVDTMKLLDGQFDEVEKPDDLIFRQCVTNSVLVDCCKNSITIIESSLQIRTNSFNKAYKDDKANGRQDGYPFMRDKLFPLETMQELICSCAELMANACQFLAANDPQLKEKLIDKAKENMPVFTGFLQKEADANSNVIAVDNVGATHLTKID